MSKKSTHIINWRKRTKERLIEAFGGYCCVCGVVGNYCIYDFHHLDSSTKEFSLSSCRANGKSWNKIVEEVKKCVMVCSNCHRMIHNGVKEVLSPNKFNEDFTDYNKLIEGSYTSIVQCPICGKYKKLNNNSYCSVSCSSKDSRKVEITKEELINLMKASSSWLDMSRKIGISDNAIRKRAKKFGIKWKKQTCIPIL